MTNLYEWYQFPDVLSVVCSKCGGEAQFLFALMTQVYHKPTLKEFQGRRAYRQLPRERGDSCDLVLFYRGLDGLKGPSPKSRSSYEPLSWYVPKTLDGWHALTEGVLVCERCGRRAKHQLTWPKEAFYQVSHKTDVLWAFDRQSATELKRFIEADLRDPEKYRYAGFLRRIPSTFLKRQSRGAVSAKLSRLLGETER